MANLGENFATSNDKNFTWPYPKPLLAKPSQPPMRTLISRYQPRIDPEDCKCDVHGFQSDMRRYKELADKEAYLHEELGKVNKKMGNLVSSVLENCDMDDETMKSTYQIDYEKRGLPVTKYRSTMAAVDSPILGSTIPSVLGGLRDGYRDPTRFRYSAIERPIIQPAKSIDLLREPETFFMWSEPLTEKSEYVNTISKLGLANMKNRQQYLEPLPSSRRRWGGV